MRNKIVLGLVALMLCVGAFCLPLAANAMNGAAPAISAWLDGELLHVEASGGDSGIEAVYVDGSRINYRVDGALEIPLRGYAGSGEYVSVYAVDFAGQKSNVVQIENPYYTAPTATPSVTAAPTVKRAAQKTTTPSTPTAIATPAPSPTETVAPTEPIPIATTANINAFTPDGTGTVLDNANESDGKEFFTVTTENESVFYLMIDRQRDSENVYLLNTVTEEDLLALAERNGSQTAVPTATPEPVQPTPTPEPETEPETAAKSGGNGGLIFFVLLTVLGAGGAGYYFKIHKPKQQASGLDEEYGESGDETDYADEPEETDWNGYDGAEADPDEPLFEDEE